ncbi:MAG TPA: amidase [Sphingobium sp.]|nr:amidase [Sphingobium sp.]
MSAHYTDSTIAYASASETLALLRSGKIGSVELLRIYEARINRWNGRLNLVVAQDMEAAMAAARRADDQGGEKGPLHGLPMTVKDTWDVTGMATTCGIPALADNRPAKDAEVVRALKQAGAIIFGKTNVPEGAADYQSYNPLFGTSSNPWDESRCVGGSSGGSAAALAAGFTPVEVGSDLAGSIRVPAHFCGVYGHKPSFGIVPLAGHVPVMPGRHEVIDMGVGGPLARSATDLEWMLDLMSRPGIAQAAAWSVKLPPSRHERLQDFRVALWLGDNSAYVLDSAYRVAIERFVDDLRGIGVAIDVHGRPGFDFNDAFALYFDALGAVNAGQLPQDVYDHILAEAQRQADKDEMIDSFARSLRMSHRDHVLLSSRRLHMKALWAEFYERYDIFLCPVSNSTAFPHDHSFTELGTLGHLLRTTQIDNQPCSYAIRYQWPSIANAAELPSTVMPTGHMVGGLPVGIQAQGPFLEDRTPLRFAQLVERELGGFTPPPGFA